MNMYLPQYFLSGLFELSCSTRPSLRLRVTSKRLSRSSVPRKCKLSLSLSSLSVNLLLILCGSKLVEQIGVYLNNLLHAFTQACLLNSEVSCRAKPLDVLINPLDVRNSAHDLQPSYPSYRSLLDDRVLYTYSPTLAYLKTTHTSVLTRSYTYFLIRLHELHRSPS